ncbi:uncharacterized protein BJ171DRAFT_616066 [Polychytrium aggregatum]|uniref:uncharacterized protein n=1 Tax=Polychytrium aggregatum TaxID=110093 RepID=UPI0022FEC311|nr:uncharacterized protein BJ171DRAFT_616066 [Polychytrium aggregatum]KAI9205406.1 hypothetical protein BJ171DRAFT_616066 [Polychytrium aggregatum]
MFGFFHLVVVIACLAAALVSAQPDHSKVYIRGISYGGSGCPQGSVGQSLSQDLTSFTLIFDSFIAYTGDGPANRKSCQINVDLVVPNGWTFSLVGVDYRGFVELPAGGIATQYSLYYFQGELTQVSNQHVFKGPISGQNYLVHDDIPLASTLWSKCNDVVPFNIKNSINVNAPAGASPQGQITTDTIDGKVTQIWGLQWKKC